jgi:predicted exporter
MISQTWLRTAVVVLAVAVVGFFTFTNVSVRYDLSFFQPGVPSRISELAIDQVRSGPASRVILVGISGGASSDLARLSRSLVQGLSASNQFRRVANGANQLDEASLRFLFENRYLLGPALDAADFTSDAMRRSITSALGKLSGLSGYAFGDLLPSDPTGRTEALIGTWRGSSQPHYKHGVWFSKDETMALIFVATAANGDDQNGQAQAQDLIESTFSGLAGGSGPRLMMAGPPVISLAVSRSIQDEAWWIGLGSVVAVLALLVAAFRSPVLLIAIAIPTAAGAIAGAIAVQVLFGSVHGITLTFGGTLAGVTSDYPVHLISHLRRGSSPVQALRGIWSPLVLGGVIAAAAFLPMTISSFPGLSQLGVIAVVGIAAGVVATVAILPWILEGHIPSEAVGWSHRIVRLVSRAKGATIVGGLVGLAWLVVAHAEVFSDDLSRLSPLPAQLVELDRKIRGELGAPDVRRLFVVDGRSAQEALTGSERLSRDLDALVRDGVIASYDAPSRYLPSGETQRMRQTLLPSEDELRSRLAIAVQGLPVDAPTFEPFVHGVTAAKSRTPLEPSDVAPVPLVGDRLAALLSNRSDGTWQAFILLSGVAQPARLAEMASRQTGDSTHYLDLQTETAHLVALYRTESLRWLAGGLAVVIGLLFAVFPVRRAARVVLSLVVSLSLTAAILLAMGMALTPFHLMSFLLVAGMGLDYAVFLSRDDVDVGDLQRTLRSIFICAVTTVIPFGLMVISSAPILRGIGLTVAIGVTLAPLTALAICGGRIRVVA